MAFPKPLDVSEVSGRTFFDSEKLGLAGEALNANVVWRCLTLLCRGQASAFNARARCVSFVYGGAALGLSHVPTEVDKG